MPSIFSLRKHTPYWKRLVILDHKEVNVMTNVDALKERISILKMEAMVADDEQSIEYIEEQIDELENELAIAMASS